MYEDEIEFSCYDNFSYCSPTKRYYFHGTQACSSSKYDYVNATQNNTILVDTNRSDILCVWFEDAAENYAIKYSGQLHVDVNATIVEKTAAQSASQALQAQPSSCVVSMDANISIDCEKKTIAKVRFRPTGAERVVRGIPTLFVGQPHDVMVVTQESIEQSGNPRAFIQFIGPETTIRYGTNNAFSFSPIQSFPARLLKTDGTAENGLLFVKMQ